MRLIKINLTLSFLMKEVSFGYYEVVGNDDAAVSRTVLIVEVLVVVLIVVIDGHWRRPFPSDTTRSSEDDAVSRYKILLLIFPCL
jgi:hypothetical protein